jgi:hypothetical protein
VDKTTGLRSDQTIVLNGCDRAHAIDYATFLGFFPLAPA